MISLPRLKKTQQTSKHCKTHGKKVSHSCKDFWWTAAWTSFLLEEKINPVDSYDVNLINFVYPLKPVWNRSSQTASEHTPMLNSQPKPTCPVLKESWAATWSQNVPCLLSRHPCRGKTSPVRYFLPRIKTSLHTMTLQGWMQQHHLVMAALILLAQLWGPARAAGVWILFLSSAGPLQTRLQAGQGDSSCALQCSGRLSSSQCCLPSWMVPWAGTQSCSRNPLRRVNRSDVPEQRSGGRHAVATNRT